MVYIRYIEAGRGPCASLHLHAPPPYVVRDSSTRSVAALRRHPRGSRGRVMHDSAYEVRRMILLRTPMKRALEYWETAALQRRLRLLPCRKAMCGILRSAMTASIDLSHTGSVLPHPRQQAIFLPPSTCSTSTG